MTKCLGCKVDIRTPSRAPILFVGISGKPEANELDPSTKSGGVIASIAAKVGASYIAKTNLVSCAPLDANGKLRYPSKQEMDACFPRFSKYVAAVSPSIIIPLGAMTSKYIIEKMASEAFRGLCPQFSYDTYIGSAMKILPVHHPSYILIYKRRLLDAYVQAIVSRAAPALGAEPELAS